MQVWMIHHLQIIGEPHVFEDQRSSRAPFPLERRVPLDLRSASPGVPCKQVTGLRNVLVHAYFRVGPLEVWVVVDRDIPAFTGASVFGFALARSSKHALV
ncbi:DUF86 domain-containing protein [Methanoculleus sp. YWC-01]|jgi:hypothetical protein|uniref:DUF86 domain-containing protein n=1 Tax=Methanoculleus nereidis TaxID=2735141 RepID=A0ABU3Z1M9_9EURY|nr:HepT-like ribonuclease domain-containing protein [Methanoculleus sp. YWC-01]MDV4342720.1 DUF86 domain-containing protein [Methanoculleus sp. YWC-01]PKL56522.1 MAG: hypothetical protein CVV35_04425 [Methanomicrobiales archaeon HGW-Methanomicrobiales-6]